MFISGNALYYSRERPRLSGMTIHERIRSLEERYDIEESEYARELGRTVAHLQD